MGEQFNSNNFNNLKENFVKMFEEEGDIYDSLKKSILDGHDHHMTNSPLSTSMVIKVLDSVAMEYYSKEFNIIQENEILKLINIEYEN